MHVGVISSTHSEPNRCLSESNKGWGYCLENGKIYHNSLSRGKKYGKRISVGDKLGVKVDLENSEISFTHNGKDLGVAFKDSRIKKIENLVAACSFDCSVPIKKYLTLKMNEKVEESKCAFMM